MSEFASELGRLGVTAQFARPGHLVGQARVGLQLVLTPWDRATYRAPATRVAVASFDRPPHPPDAAEIGTANGFAYGFIGFFARHRLRMTSGPAPGGMIEASPGPLWDDGYGFTIYLEPKPAS